MKGFKLPKVFAEKWVDTLRTTNLKQGRIALNSVDGYCCLGIACIMVGANEKEIYSLQVPTTITDGFSEFEFYKYIPRELIGDASSNKLVGKVVTMNDTGSTFKEIADWIEENVEFI